MSEVTTRYAFFKGQIVPIESAKVSVMTHALNYGTGVFGGLRGYWNEEQEQLYVFRIHDHMKRFIQSASLIRIEVKYSADELVNIITELLRAEGWRENCYIRPLAYKASELIGVRLHNLEDEVTIFSLPFGRYIQNEEGAHVCFSAWRRVEDNAIPARGKIVGAYANSALIKTDAALSGYDEAIVLNEDGHISEMSAANFFMIRDGVAITPPKQSNVLEGIVRRSLIQLLRDEMGVEVVERDIDRTELYVADEAFMCGTGVQVAAITKVEHRSIGTGSIGPITDRLRNLFFDVVSGRVDKYRDWLTPVYQNEPVR
ncbi:MAG: branched-chain amino acid transaminase [Chloroflexi bacterium]|nr:branched-chain amino acid transaminase [Chloroflexota bacterium]MDL1885640.1 branched-chain amino acid transaminase [Anaerolineae bacterium CFX8]